MSLPERFERHLGALAPPPGPAVVAVSGGPDSLALLDLLAGAGSARAQVLEVAHADHGIHAESGRVAGLVRAAAARYGLPCHVAALALGPATTETAARRARYQWLDALADRLGAQVILTAHQRDDQVETVLMRLLRGSGPAGLAGIPVWRGRLLRPLLPFSRVELADHLRDQGIEAWVDPANQDPRHLRSWLRTVVLPLLRQGVPDLDRRILALAARAAVDRGAWDRLLATLPGLDPQREVGGVSVAASPLRGYDSGVRLGLLGAMGRRVGCIVGPARAARIERLLKRGRSGAVAELGAGFTAELAFDRLQLFRVVRHPSGEEVRVAGPAGVVTVGDWTLEWRREPAPPRLERSQATTWLVDGTYLARPWRPGDRILPLGGIGRRLVVRCMQDEKVPRSARANWPVVERDGAVVWVPGVCRADLHLPAPGAPALRFDAHRG